MIHKLMPVQSKVFDDYTGDPVKEMNEFIKGIDVIDIKMNTLVATTGMFFSRYLVIYREDFQK